MQEKKAACVFIAEQGVHVEKGAFGQYIHITSLNDGLVTFLLDSSTMF